MASEHFEQVAQATAQHTTQGGAIVGIVGWLMSINWIGLIGATAAIVGLAVSWYYQIKRDNRERYYQQKRDKREQAEHDKRMSATS